MCCIIYYVYLKCLHYFKKDTKKDTKKEENKNVSKPQPTLQELAEYRYNAKQINDFVRNKQRVYWANYD